LNHQSALTVPHRRVSECRSTGEEVTQRCRLGFDRSLRLPHHSRPGQNFNVIGALSNIAPDVITQRTGLFGIIRDDLVG